MSPFVIAFDHFLKNQKFEPIIFQYRAEESIYINLIDGAINCTFSIKFDDPDDIKIAKVLLTEFKDSKKNDKTLGNAPSVSFYQGIKPLELQGMKTVEGDTKESLLDYGFVCLSLRQNQMEKDRTNTINLLLQFRNYLHYHLKCSKAYMHMRMRERVASLLTALDYARDKTGIEVKKKTFSGKTFEEKK